MFGFHDYFVYMQDNVLLEWTLIAELSIAGRLHAVVPILVGDVSSDSDKATDCSLVGLSMSQLLKSQAFKDLADVVYSRVNRQVNKFV
jgi:hypothetical protein